MLHLGRQHASCTTFTTKQDGSYAYPSELLPKEFFDAIIEDKLTNEKYIQLVEETYPLVEIIEEMSEEVTTA